MKFAMSGTPITAALTTGPDPQHELQAPTSPHHLAQTSDLRSFSSRPSPMVSMVTGSYASPRA